MVQLRLKEVSVLSLEIKDNQMPLDHMKKRRDIGYKIRVKFSKYGTMKYIGHLDIMRFFQKLIRRAGLDIAYSEGFHPHQIMSFANPLGVGMQSTGEYLDITLNSITSSEDIRNRLSRATVEGLDILDVRLLKDESGNAMASVKTAEYIVGLNESDFSTMDDFRHLVDEFWSKDSITVVKKTKKGQREIDLKCSMHSFCVLDEPDKKFTVFMKVNAGSSENIRPELVINSFYDFANKKLADFSYSITRVEQYDEEGKALIDVGDLF